MIKQTLITSKNIDVFESRVNTHLASGWKIIPHTMVATDPVYMETLRRVEGQSYVVGLKKLVTEDDE